MWFKPCLSITVLTFILNTHTNSSKVICVILIALIGTSWQESWRNPVYAVSRLSRFSTSRLSSVECKRAFYSCLPEKKKRQHLDLLSIIKSLDWPQSESWQNHLCFHFHFTEQVYNVVHQRWCVTNPSSLDSDKTCLALQTKIKK